MKRKFSSGFQLWAALYAVLTVVSAIAGNLILKVKDSRIALDKEMACRIMI